MLKSRGRPETGEAELGRTERDEELGEAHATKPATRPVEPGRRLETMSDQVRRDVEAAMFRRHPDAAPENVPSCKQIDDGFKCTKGKGHEGDHVAHGTGQTVCHTWT